MKVQITDLKDTLIRGVRYKTEDTYKKDIYKETFFEWQPMPLVSDFSTEKITAGILKGWHHVPEFHVIEYHEDKELFYYVSGTALMLFVDIQDGKPVMDTAQIVRVPAGCELEVEKGKGHFVAVAESDCFTAVVIGPVQGAPRIELPEPVIGV